MANKLVKITNIDYNTEYEDIDGTELALPTELCIEISNEDLEYYGDDLAFYIADTITDETGFFVKDFDFEITTNYGTQI